MYLFPSDLHIVSGLSALYSGKKTLKVLLKKTAHILQYLFLECGWTCDLLITTELMGCT